MNIGETEVAAGIAISEFFVIESEQVENSGLQIVDMNGIVDHVEAEIVGLTVNVALFETSAGEPHGKGLRMMIASQASAEGGVGFDHGSTAKLPSPEDESIVEQTSTFKILDEGSAALIGGLTVVAVIAEQIRVGVPAFVIDVHEADAAFDQAACEETGPSKGRFVGIATIHLQGGLGFGFEIH